MMNNIPFEEVKSLAMDITLPEIVVFSIAVAELPGPVEAWLKEHHCHVKPTSEGGATVFFPAGTMKSEILPRTSQERYEITLPRAGAARHGRRKERPVSVQRAARRFRRQTPEDQR